MSRRTITIHIDKLSIGYPEKRGAKYIAKDICSDIMSGELTCLLGANGVGKSTLLRTLSAFLPPLSGEIAIMGRPLGSYSNRDLAKTLSVVLTDKFSLRNMTVEELIGMGRSPYTGFWGTLGRSDREIVASAIRMVRIEELSSRLVQTLSDGERQKVMIAKAFAQETPVVFLDEPTAFLDFPTKVEIMQLLHRLSRTTNKTIFLSTHDLELALQIADKIWLMDKKNGIITGTPEDLSLNGSLTHFFSSKGILFDQDTGLFHVNNEYDRQICLIGHGQKYAMVRKALSRNGILADRHVQSPQHIDSSCTSGFDLCDQSGASVHADTIDALLMAVERMLLSQPDA